MSADEFRPTTRIPATAKLGGAACPLQRRWTIGRWLTRWQPRSWTACPTSSGRRSPGRFDPIAFRDRCVGSLVLGAIGDGFGGPNERKSAADIRLIYGVEGMREPRHPTLRWSDDTQLTMVVAESLVASRGTFDPQDFVHRLVAWLPSARGIGHATREAVLALAAGEPWYEVGPRIDSSGNGAAMRSAPVGLVHALDPSPGPMLAGAVHFALPTHGGEVGVASAVAMAAAVAWLARAGASGARTFDPVGLMAFVVAASGPLESAPSSTRRDPARREFLRDRLAAIPGWLDRTAADVFAETWTGAFALESVPAAFYAFLRSPAEPKTTLRTAANASHDTDTIASMAGNLAGAWLGADRVRAAVGDWWDRLEDREVVVGAARRLSGLSSGT